MSECGGLSSQSTIPQYFGAALDTQNCREERQGFILELVEAEILPRLPVDQREVFLHIGAGRCHLTRRVADHFMSAHAVEPNTYLLPQPAELEDLVVHTEDMMLVRFPHGEKFAFILADHLLASLATSSARADPAAYLACLVELLQEGGLALIGTLAPRGPLHDFLSAVNPAYVNSAVVRAALAQLPGVASWVVERSNVASLPSVAQLEQLLALHAFLVQPGAGAEAVPAGAAAAGGGPRAAGAAGEVAAPSPEWGSAAQQEGAEAELIHRFVADASDGAGRWNWVEEDDIILVQKLPAGATGEV